MVVGQVREIRMDEDTDVLLALLETSLPSWLAVPKEELLEALISSGGNVELAARVLNDTLGGNRHTSWRSNSKRKAEAGLDAWLSRSKRQLISKGTRSKDDGLLPDELQHTLGSSTVSTASEVGLNSANNLPPSTRPSPLSLVLKDRTPATAHVVQRLPVLLLSTAEAIANHTPTTLHTSILPAG